MSNVDPSRNLIFIYFFKMSTEDQTCFFRWFAANTRWFVDASLFLSAVSCCVAYLHKFLIQNEAALSAQEIF